ncbi:carboxypeptidase-like regulatory domain-containing protein [Aeoliella sp.]|uniref:carboxypeptidase-like regulatory domain-containing protein n=1 Tax=Aeoliella sp. TaxID=2795800 RepID=UPI003CCC3042
MKHFTLRFSFAVTAIGLVATTGCGGKFDSTVQGKVTLDGEAVPQGTVSFLPTAGGPTAFARIDSSGTYEIRTGREAGLSPGDYLVAVVANEPAPVSQTADGGPPPPGKPITPPWYRSQETSGLKFTVTPGKNEINLDLTSQPPEGWKPPRRRR